MAFVRHLKISCLGAAATLVDLSDKAIVAALPYAAATLATGMVMSTTPVAAAAPAAAVTANLRLATFINYLFYNFHKLSSALLNASCLPHRSS